MKLPVQHVTAEAEPPSRVPSPSFSPASTFASAMRVLMQPAAPSEAAPGELNLSAPSNPAEKLPAKELEIRATGQFAQEKSGSIAALRTGEGPAGPGENVTGEDELIKTSPPRSASDEEEASAKDVVVQLPPPAFLVVHDQVPIARSQFAKESPIDKSTVRPAAAKRELDSDRQNANANGDSRELLLVVPGSIPLIPVPASAVEPAITEAPVPKNPTCVKTNSTERASLPGRLPEMPQNTARVSTTGGLTDRSLRTAGAMTEHLPIGSAPISNFVSTSESKHSESNLAKQRGGPSTADFASINNVPPTSSGPVHSKSIPTDGTKDRGRSEHLAEETKTELPRTKPEMIRTEPAAIISTATTSHSYSSMGNATQVGHDRGDAIDTRPSHEIARQVLQRMDTALPIGSTKLHADLRHLEVGVATGTLGWVEVRATTGTSGRVDATLHVQNDASARIVEAQSTQIANFAQEHSVNLGELSVGVGAGNSDRHHNSESMDGGALESNPRHREEEKTAVNLQHRYHMADRVTLISLRA